jgi:integrase
MSLYRRKLESSKRTAANKKRRDPVWWCSFVVNKKRYQFSTQRRSKTAARDVESKLRNAVLDDTIGLIYRRTVPLFKDEFQNFLKWIQTHRAARTYERYHSAGVVLRKHFGEMRIDEIDEDDVQEFIKSRQTHRSRGKGIGVGNGTINADIAVACVMFSRLQNKGKVKTNPFAGQSLDEPPPRKYRVLSYREEEIYLAYAKRPLRDLAVLMIEQGCRPDEIRRLLRSDVNLAEGQMEITYGKTASAVRTLNLTARSREVLAKLVSEAKGEALFPTEKDADRPARRIDEAHIDTMREIMKDYPKFRRFCVYDLRHSFASRAAMAGVDLVTLSGLLGHADIRMCKKYAHPQAEHRAEMMKKLEAYNKERMFKEFEDAKGAANLDSVSTNFTN